MLLPDYYSTIASNQSAEIKEKSSRFIAFAFLVTSDEQAKKQLADLKKEHHAAAHHCWAYVLEADASLQKSSDDREPSGTAGKPILRAILSAGLTNVLIVVVRYFGGKLLGVPGLIAAYGKAADTVLLNAPKKQKQVRHIYEVLMPYEHQHQLIRLLKQDELKFYPTIQGDQEGIIFEVSPSKRDKILEKIQDNLLVEPKNIANEK